MADISSITLPNGGTYNLKDATARDSVALKVAKAGDTMTGNLIVPAVRIANTYYGISFGRTTGTPVETVLYSGIKWLSGTHMPVIHVTGYAYGLSSPVEFKIGFYIYSNKIGWCGVTNMGSWSPEVYLFKYTNADNIACVAIGFKGSCYFLQLQVDMQDEMGKFNGTITNSNAWSWTFSTSTGVIPATDDGTSCVKVPYKADILNPAKVNGHTVNADVPSGAKFTDTTYTATTSKLVTTTVPNVTSAGSAPTLGTAIPADDITAWSAGTLPTLGTAIPADDITAWSAGTLPTLGTAIPADDITNWSAGTLPTLGTAIPADDITAWTSNTPTSFSISGEKLTITPGSSATLSYTAKSIPNVTGVGTLPSLSYTAKSIPNVTGVGTLPSLSYTAKSIPNVTGVGTLPSLSYTAKSIPNVTSVGSAPTLGTAITVATGSVASNGGGATVATGITAS